MSTSMANMRLGCLVAVTVLVAVACQPQQAATTPDAVSQTTASTPSQPSPSGQQPQTRAATLAGRYRNQESVLELLADGNYVQTLQAADGSVSASGTWHALQTGSILLRPNGEAASDVVFEVIGNSQLRTADGAHAFQRVVAK